MEKPSGMEISMDHLQHEAADAAGDSAWHTPGCSWVPPAGKGQWEEEGRWGARSKSGAQEPMPRHSPSFVPSGQAWEQRAPASPRISAQAAALLGAEQGRESKSCQVLLAV